MKHLLLFFVLAAALMVQGAPLTIVKDHRSDYVIAVAENALSGPREAAKELQTLIRRATGAQLPIVTKAGSRKAIFLASDSKLPPEGFRIKTDKGNLYIWGHDGTGDPRRFAHTEFNRAGTWFGVNYVTEKFLDDFQVHGLTVATGADEQKNFLETAVIHENVACQKL
jgi:hypothetical protein